MYLPESATVALGILKVISCCITAEMFLFTRLMTILGSLIEFNSTPSLNQRTLFGSDKPNRTKHCRIKVFPELRVLGLLCPIPRISVVLSSVRIKIVKSTRTHLKMVTSSITLNTTFSKLHPCIMRLKGIVGCDLHFYQIGRW